MPERSHEARFTDIVEACERLRGLLAEVTLESFEVDWQKQWLVERGIEIISEASRHLSDDLKARHPQIPWRNVAGIANILRHDFEHVSPNILWTLVKVELAQFEQVCRDELAAIQARNSGSWADSPAPTPLHNPRHPCFPAPNHTRARKDTGRR